MKGFQIYLLTKVPRSPRFIRWTFFILVHVHGSRLGSPDGKAPCFAMWRIYLGVALKNSNMIRLTEIHILYMRRWSFSVVRPRLSCSSPNFSKPRSRTTNLDLRNHEVKNLPMSPCFTNLCVRSKLTHRLLGRLKPTIPNLLRDDTKMSPHSKVFFSSSSHL